MSKKCSVFNNQASPRLYYPTLYRTNYSRIHRAVIFKDIQLYELKLERHNGCRYCSRTVW